MSTKANTARDKKRRDDAAEAKAKAKAKEEATAKAEAEEEEEASASSNEEGGEDEADEEAGSNGEKGTSNKTALQEVMTTFVNDSMELVIRVNKGEKITEKEKYKNMVIEAFWSSFPVECKVIYMYLIFLIRDML